MILYLLNQCALKSLCYFRWGVWTNFIIQKNAQIQNYLFLAARIPPVECTQDEGSPSFYPGETPRIAYKYTHKRQARKPYRAVEARAIAAPRCTVVSGQIDLKTGGAGGRPRLGSCKYLKSRAIHVLSSIYAIFRRAVRREGRQLFFRLRVE